MEDAATVEIARSQVWQVAPSTTRRQDVGVHHVVLALDHSMPAVGKQLGDPPV